MIAEIWDFSMKMISNCISMFNFKHANHFLWVQWKKIKFHNIFTHSHKHLTHEIFIFPAGFVYALMGNHAEAVNYFHKVFVTLQVKTLNGHQLINFQQECVYIKLSFFQIFHVKVIYLQGCKCFLFFRISYFFNACAHSPFLKFKM